MSPSKPKVFEKKNSKSLCNKVTQFLEDAKAENIVEIDLENKSVFADYMVIASGISARHVLATSTNLKEELKEIGVKKVTLEGSKQGDWVLLDAGDIIIHLFRPEIREFYRLEDMWNLDIASK